MSRSRWLPYVAGLLGLGLFALGLWGAMRIDQDVDRTRPMYQDMASMQALQSTSILFDGKPVAVKLDAAEPTATIGRQEFTVSEGVSLEVRTEADNTFCIKVSNAHGDVSEWICQEPDPDSDTTDTSSDPLS